MKKFYAALLSAACMLGASQASGQGYFLKDKGQPFGYSTYEQVAISGNDVLSPAHKIPFSFKFMGKNVTHYKVSDNGYITFDTSETVSRSKNWTLPNANAPKDAILAFWDDFEVSSANGGTKDGVYIWKNRLTNGDSVETVYFQSLTPKGADNMANGFFFAIQIYKSGLIETFHLSRSGAILMSGTVGVSQDATTGVDFDDRNDLDFLENTTTADRFRFFEGTQPANDVAMFGLDYSGLFLKKDLTYIKKDGTFSGAFSNIGKSAVNSIEVSYQIDGGTVATTDVTLTTPAAASGGSANFTFVPAGLEIGKKQTVKFWISKINGNADENTANDNAATVNNFAHAGTSTAKKRPLLEEFTTAACVWCPDGHVVMEQIETAFPDAIVLMHHAGYGTDAMTLPEHTTLAQAFVTGAPMGAFDRVKFANEPVVAISRNVWGNRAAQRTVVAAPAGLAITPSFNPATKQIKVKVDASLYDTVPAGDLALNVILVEQEVTETGTGYNQANALNTAAGHPMAGRGNPIVGYVHKRVSRAFPTGAWGEKIAAGKLKVGGTYSKEYTIVMDAANWKGGDLSVVAFLSYNNTMDVADRTILNATEVDLSTVGIGEVAGADFINALYPNPTNGLTNVSFTLENAGQVSASIVDMTGRTVQSIATQGLYGTGKHSLQFDASALSKGIYFVNLNVDGQMSAKSIVE